MKMAIVIASLFMGVGFVSMYREPSALAFSPKKGQEVISIYDRDSRFLVTSLRIGEESQNLVDHGVQLRTEEHFDARLHDFFAEVEQGHVLTLKRTFDNYVSTNKEFSKLGDAAEQVRVTKGSTPLKDLQVSIASDKSGVVVSRELLGKDKLKNDLDLNGLVSLADYSRILPPANGDLEWTVPVSALRDALLLPGGDLPVVWDPPDNVLSRGRSAYWRKMTGSLKAKRLEDVQRDGSSYSQISVTGEIQSEYELSGTETDSLLVRHYRESATVDCLLLWDIRGARPAAAKATLMGTATVVQDTKAAPSNGERTAPSIHQTIALDVKSGFRAEFQYIE